MLLATKQLQQLAELQRQCISPESITNTTDIHAIPCIPGMPLNTYCKHALSQNTVWVFLHIVKTYS